MTLPRPGASKMDNCAATLLLNGNGSRDLDLDRIADAQGFDRSEWSTRFAQLETQWSLTPRNCEEMDK